MTLTFLQQACCKPSVAYNYDCQGHFKPAWVTCFTWVLFRGLTVSILAHIMAVLSDCIYSVIVNPVYFVQLRLQFWQMISYNLCRLEMTFTFYSKLVVNQAMITIAWLRNTSKAWPVPLYSICHVTASNAIWPYGIVVSGYSTLIACPSRLTQLQIS